MKTERDLFQENYLAKINTYAKFNQSKYTGEYEDYKEQACWEMWLSSAQREGCKLVPVDPPEGMDIKICRLVDHRIDVFEADRIYKAMIGAAE